MMSCKEKPKEPICKEPLMRPSRYGKGTDTIIPNIKNLKTGFLIVVDSNYKADNYISSGEEYAIYKSKILDSAIYDYDKEWRKLTKKQKMKKLIEERDDWKKTVPIRHKEYNDGKQIVWLINNTNDTIVLQSTLGQFYCVLQAKNIFNEWKSIELAPMAFDNFCQGYTEIPPHRANFFKAEIPDTGNYRTTLRFALLGLDSIYYSHEIKGKINYCQFKFHRGYSDYYQLDTFRRIVYWKYKNR